MLIIGLIMIILASAISSTGWKTKIDLVTGRFTVTLINRITIIVLLYAGLLSYHLSYQDLISSGITIYNGLFQITYITQIFDMFILFTAGTILQLTSFNHYQNNNINVNNNNNKNVNNIHKNNNNNSELLQHLATNISEYPIICVFSVLGASFLISSYDLISMYLSIELQSYGLYILASLNKDSQESTSAGLKYFLLGSLASGLILLGSSLIYVLTGLTNFESLSILLNIDSQSISYITLAIIIILIGFSFKIASAPFHHWAPDVYDGVPTIVTTWIVIIPKLSILLFLFHFINLSQLVDNNLNSNQLSIFTQSNYLLIVAFLSLIIGTILGLTQTRIKRLLAYSSISNVGFLLLALAINTSDSTEAFLFYLISYTITNINIFFVLLAFGYLINTNNNNNTIKNKINQNYSDIIENNSSPIKYITQLKGQSTINPLLSLSLAISLFSFAGVPPLIGFFGKQMVLLSAAENGYYFLAIIGIITSVISAAYYLKIIKIIYFDKSNSITNTNSNSNIYINNNINNDFIKTVSEDNNEIVSFTLPPIEDKLLSVDNIEDDKIISSSLALTISIITLVILLFLVKPNILLNSAHIMALSCYL